MKPNIRPAADKDLDIRPGDEVVKMSIDASAMAHVMGVLTDLYSNPKLAVIREYSTNAFDAHVEAKLDNTPIMVTLPSGDDPYFRVRDFGAGLDIDDIRDIYSKYGTSTKRSTNDAVGMLGLGCKSALTYADEFFVTSIKDGVRIQVNVQRNGEDIPFMNIISQTHSEEGSGTEIAVPVDSYDFDEFEEEAADFYKFWDQGTVKVNGLIPTPVQGITLDADMIMVKGQNHNIVVMGNVPYPVAGYVSNGWVAKVKIGDVDFSPDREKLVDNERTNKVVRDLSLKYSQLKEQKLQEHVDQAQTGWEAVERYTEARRLGFRKALVWKDFTLNETVFPNGSLTNEFMKLNGTKERRRRRWHKMTSSTINDMAAAVWLEGFTGRTFSPTQEEKLDLWKTNNGVTAEHFYAVTAVPKDLVRWIDPSKIKSWLDVKATKLPKVAGANGRKAALGAARYDAHTEDGLKTLALDEINPTNLMFCGKRDDSYPDYDLLKFHFRKFTVLTLGANQLAKVQREFPKIRRFSTVEKELRDKWVSELTEEDKVYLSSRGQSETYKVFDEDRILDPVMKQAISLAKSKRDALENALRVHSPVYIEADVPTPLDKYPLVQALRSWQWKDMEDHIYFYMNGIYQAKQMAASDPSNEG